MKTKTGAKNKKKPKPLKLEYLRQIHKSLMFHVTQPHEKEFGLYEAPPVILMRVVYVLETMTRAYKKALKLAVAAEKARGKAGASGSLESTVAFLKAIVKGME